MNTPPEQPAGISAHHIVGLDIEHYGHRHGNQLVELRSTLYALLHASLQAAKISPTKTHILDRVVSPPLAGWCVMSSARPAFRGARSVQRVAGSPNRGKVLLSKRVMAQIWEPERVRTISPTVWKSPVCGSRA
jgi:hypothetical protein